MPEGYFGDSSCQSPIQEMSLKIRKVRKSKFRELIDGGMKYEISPFRKRFEIAEWCENNCDGKYFIFDFHKSNNNTFYVKFKKRSDTLKFELAWFE